MFWPFPPFQFFSGVFCISVKERMVSNNQGWEGYFGNVISYRLLVTLFKMQ